MMKKRIAVILMSTCISFAAVTGVYGADFSDGAGDISAIASQVVAQAEAKAQAYQDRKTEVEKAAVEYRASEIQKETTEIREKAIEAAKKKKEEERVAARQEVADFAVQFVGNPYVWGGTSLTNGADCSGFTMSVFAQFGYSLPRTAAAQYEASNKKDISQLETGDLVFYGAGGINHVALYIGNGKIVHASGAATGIKISDYNYETPVGIGSYMK